MKLKKQDLAIRNKKEIAKKIGGVDVLLSKIKYSILYLIVIEKKSELGIILERYVKFGRTSDPKARFKQHEKHYIGYEIGYIYLSINYGKKWLDVECAIYEKLIRAELDTAFIRYKDAMPNKIHGYTEMYMADKEMEIKDFIVFVKGEIIRLDNLDCRNLLDFSFGGSPIFLLD